MADTWTYTSGSTKALNRLRFLLGDHRGTVGVVTGWLFTDQELTDCLIQAANGKLPNAATWDLDTSGYGLILSCAIALTCRANREAMQAGVAGTTDTTDRVAALINAMRNLNALDLPQSATDRVATTLTDPTNITSSGDPTT